MIRRHLASLGAAAAALLLLSGNLFAATPSPAELRVSDNRRFLVMADGRPFFWLGDTGWEKLPGPGAAKSK